MKVSHFLRSKWTLAVLIIIGLIYFEGRVVAHSVGRQVASEPQVSEKNPETQK